MAKKTTAKKKTVSKKTATKKKVDAPVVDEETKTTKPTAEETETVVKQEEPTVEKDTAVQETPAEPAKEDVAAEAKETVEEPKEEPVKEKPTQEPPAVSPADLVKEKPAKTVSPIKQMLDDRCEKYKSLKVVGPRDMERFAEEWADILILAHNSNKTEYYNAVVDFMKDHPDMVSNSNGIIASKRRLTKPMSTSVITMVSAFSVIAVARARKMRPKLNLEAIHKNIKNIPLFHFIANIVG